MTISGTEQIELAVTEPYCAPWVFDFLAQRALPGIETVTGLHYERRLGAAGDSVLTVDWRRGALRLTLPIDAPLSLKQVQPRVAALFDVAADSAAIDARLARDPLLAEQLARSPGLRVPGAWDGFEIGVRAILGQQVSVARARNLAIALCERFGDGFFPTPAQLVEADVSAIGMPGRRGAAVRALAQAVSSGALDMGPDSDGESLATALVELPGIGPWTAGYIAMRVAGDADAYADADWVLLKELSMTAAAARRAAERWRPYRAYALMALWARSAAFVPDWRTALNPSAPAP